MLYGRQRVAVSFRGAGSSTCARADENTGVLAADGILLADSSNPQQTTRVEYALKIEGKLLTPAQNGTSAWNLNSSGKFAFDQRRFASDATGPFAVRAVRRFAAAETESVVDKDHATSVVLPSQARLIHLYGTEDQLLQLSPHVRLTRPQVDLLQIPCDPLVATIPAAVALQLLAYHVARLRGCAIDQPRNLAKSVTVE